MKTSPSLTEAIFDASPMGLALYGADGACLAVNAALAEIVGFSREEIQRHRFHDISPWKESGLLESALAALETGLEQRREAHLRTSAGRELWLACVFRVLDDIAGPRLLVMVSDLTELRQTQKEVADDLYRRMFEHAPIGWYRARLDGQGTIMINERLAADGGYTLEELRRTPNAIHWADQGVRDRFIDLLLRDGLVREYEADLVLRDGTPRTYLISARVDREAGYIDGILVDIRERKRMELALRESEERLRLVLSSAMEAIVVFDRDMRMLFLNDLAARMFGGSREEMLGKLATEIMGGRIMDRHLVHVREVLDGGQPMRVTGLAPFPSGPRWMESQLVPLRSPEGEVDRVLNIARDITDRRQMEEELERSNADLRRALAEIKTLSGLIPICSGCKKVRNDQGFWQAVETYIHEHSEAEFTHGLCPDCVPRYFPGER